METTNSPATGSVATARPPSHDIGQRPSRWLVRRRGLAGAVTIAIAATVLALSQNWLALAELIPLLYVLPCAVMMFMCMKGHSKQANTAPIAGHFETPTASDIRN